MFGGVLAGWFPELEQVYTEAACEKWGAAFAKIAERKGWKVAEFLAWLGPWVPVGLASQALLVPTVRVIKARIDELKAERAAKAAEEQPGTATRSASS